LAYFDYDKCELTQQSKTTLDNLLDRVKSKDIIQIEVNGYTDSDGDPAYNKKLSQDRATTAQQYLASKGILIDKFKIQFFGEDQPTAGNNNEEGKQKNRRVEIVITYKYNTETVKSDPIDTIKEKSPAIQAERIPKKGQRLKSFAVPTDKETEIGKVYLEHKEPILCNSVVTVAIFDAGVEDLDAVSLYFNFHLIIDKQELKRKPNAACIQVLHLNKGESNSIIAKAWNYGLESVNTLRIEVYEGDITDSNGLLKKNKKPLAIKIMNSKPGLSSALLLKCI
jgi:hypothetical protein